MLRNSFYDIVQSHQDGYVIRFNASHPIFFGHFLGKAIVPGACVVQIAEELAALTYGLPVRFTSVHDLKFRQPITPDQAIMISFQKIAELMCKVQCIDAMKEPQLIISFNAQFDSITP